MNWTLSLVWLLLSTPADPASQVSDPPKETIESRYRIHAITVDPGEPLFTRWGHIALMVEDQERNTKKVYNFGTFNFSDPELQVKYAQGYLHEKRAVDLIHDFRHIAQAYFMGVGEAFDQFFDLEGHNIFHDIRA